MRNALKAQLVKLTIRAAKKKSEEVSWLGKGKCIQVPSREQRELWLSSSYNNQL